MVNAYQLAVVVTLLPFASLGERIGYRRVYLAGDSRLRFSVLNSRACALSVSRLHHDADRLSQRVAQNQLGSSELEVIRRQTAC